MDSKTSFSSIGIIGFKKASEEYGSIEITKDKERYDKVKNGLGDISPNQIFYGDENELEFSDVLDFIHDDNPLKIYFLDNFYEE